MRGYFELKSFAGDGVERIKKALSVVGGFAKDDVGIEVEYVGAPKYRIVIESEDYKTAETVLKKVVDEVMKTMRKLGGEANFVREAV